MRIHWPADTVFHRLVLDVEQDCCSHCGSRLHICAHRTRRFYTLQYPLELCCRLAHCSDPSCPNRPQTLSPTAELSLALPGWHIAWDVFCFIGHRRFARHWSVPQILAELRDSYAIRLSADAISVYIHHYQSMVAARQQDFAQMYRVYRDIPYLALTIDGLQPEKGHETLYAVRELNAQRVWFGTALLESSAAEVRHLLVRAHAMAQRLGKPIRLWLSDKQDAFVKGIASVFPGVPHRYCANHFLRDLAKPMLETDSHAKVRLRKKVRGLRAIEREMLQHRRKTESQAIKLQGVTSKSLGGTGTSNGQRASTAEPERVGQVVWTEECDSPRAAKRDEAGQVVLDYCAAVRGILNDDQGGPLHPPGLRMAEALAEVRASLGRNLKLNKPGPAHGQLERLAGCIDRGLDEAKVQQEQVREQLQEIRKIAETLNEETGTLKKRQNKYERLLKQYQSKGEEFHEHLAKTLTSWAAGLFVRMKGRKQENIPTDNLDLERWFRIPKGHERRIHGHRHAGVRIVQEGPTLLLVLDAHVAHSEPFTAEDLLPYRFAQDPPDQQEAVQRRKIMRKARSQKKENIC